MVLMKVGSLHKVCFYRKPIIYGSFEYCLGRLEEGVWAVSSCSTQVSLRVTLGRILNDLKAYIIEYVTYMVYDEME